MLVGPTGVDLTAALPEGWRRHFEDPVAGRVADATWVTPRYPLGIHGVLTWRVGACDHLVLESGRCPAAVGEVAVSDADARRFDLRAGQEVLRQSSISEPVRVAIVGIYRPRDPSDGYWFANPPIGSSGFDAQDQPQSNPWFTVQDFGGAPAILETLDLRLDRSAATVDSLPEIRHETDVLAATAPRAKLRLTTSVPQSLDRIAAERARAVSGLTLTLVQLAALIVVVVALLSSVTLTSQRGELGLARLRGESRRRLVRGLTARWGVAIALGWVIGWLSALAVLVALAGRLPGDHGLPAGPALPIAAGLTLLGMGAAVIPAARALLGQPVVDLLRSAPPASTAAGRRELIVDVAVFAVAASGLLVAWQSGTSNVLSLLVPSLLAVAAGALLGRALVWLAGIARRRASRKPARPAGLLTAILLLRLRGLRLMIVTLCLASAFVVVAIQVQAIGGAVRRHEAQVRSGAAAVLTVQGEPSQLLGALDRLDPNHAGVDATMTAVVVTRRTDAGATRAMFIEPAAFARVAYGADLAADDATWRSITAPAVAPIEFAGNAVSVTIGAHPSLGGDPSDDEFGRNGSRAELGLVYLDRDGQRRSTALGQVSLEPSDGQTLRHAVDCDGGCRLLRITLTPDGPLRGALPVTGLDVMRSGGARPVELGPADDWAPVPAASPDADIAVRPGDPGLTLAVSTGGNAVAIQHRWAPAVLPVLTAADVRPDVDPTVAAPDGQPVPIKPVARATDAIPRELTGVAVGDLESVLRNGPGPTTPKTSVQLWLSAGAAARLPEITASLLRQGLPVVRTDTLPTVIAAQRLTASALTAAVAPAFAVLAMVFGTLAVALTAAGQRAALVRDLAALRLAGVRPRAFRTATLRTYGWPTLLAVLAGIAVGAVGCSLVIGALPLLPDASPAIHHDLSLRLPALIGSAVSCLVVLLAAASLSALRILRGVRSELVRDPDER